MQPGSGTSLRPLPTTLEAEHHFHGDEPHEDECSRDDHNASKDRFYEDTIVQSEDRELCADDGNIIEMAEDVVALFLIRTNT